MEVFSTLVGSGIQGQIVGSYHASMTQICATLNGTLQNRTSEGLTDTLENTVRAWPPAHAASRLPSQPLGPG